MEGLRGPFLRAGSGRLAHAWSRFTSGRWQGRGNGEGTSMGNKPPVTPAVRMLRAAKVAWEPRPYDYEPPGGTARSAAALGVDEHRVIKTLVLEMADGQPLICLMHGDREVSLRGLARHLGVKTVKPCEPSVAEKHSGYKVGGTSPFGTRKRLPIYVERTVLELDSIIINGGKRGFLVELSPEVLVDVLGAEPVDVATG